MKDDLSWLPWVLGGGAVALAAYGFATDTKLVIGNSGPMLVKGVGNGAYLRPDAADAFLTMVQQASLEGVDLVAGSAFRSMAEQAVIYARYITGTNIVNGSNAKAAAPGTSNHGAGIAIDIANLNGQAISYSSPEYVWLAANAHLYGFDHTEGASINEPWHWDFYG